MMASCVMLSNAPLTSMKAARATPPLLMHFSTVFIREERAVWVEKPDLKAFCSGIMGFVWKVPSSRYQRASRSRVFTKNEDKLMGRKLLTLS